MDHILFLLHILLLFFNRVCLSVYVCSQVKRMYICLTVNKSKKEKHLVLTVL